MSVPSCPSLTDTAAKLLLCVDFAGIGDDRRTAFQIEEPVAGWIGDFGVVKSERSIGVVDNVDSRVAAVEDDTVVKRAGRIRVVELQAIAHGYLDHAGVRVEFVED